MKGLRLEHAPGGNMLAGPGPRRDCARESACLGAWARTSAQFGLDGPAHCATWCPTWEPPRRELDAIATARRAV